MKPKQIGTILPIVGAVVVVISVLGLFQVDSNTRENRYLVSVSGSMEPTFNSGDVLKVRLGVQDIHEIHVAPKGANPPGDIIVFRKPGNPEDLIVHRAVANGTDITYYLITQGDANPGPDGWRVRETDLIGKVVEINPPFWTYNFVFWIITLGMGTVFIVVGVVVRQRKPRKTGVIQEKPTPALAPEPEKKVLETKAVYCIFCGEELPSHAVYCRKCGKKVE